MTAIRWALAVVLMFFAVGFFASWNWALAVAALVLVIALAATCGAFRASTWVMDIPEDHPDALGSLDLLEREYRTREEQRRI